MVDAETGLLSKKVQAQIQDLRASGKHEDVISTIINHFDRTPLLSAGFLELDSLFVDATNDLQMIAFAPTSAYLSGVFLGKYAVLALYSGRREIWERAMSVIDEVRDSIPELRQFIIPFWPRYLLRQQGIVKAIDSLPSTADIQQGRIDGQGFMWMCSLLDVMIHALSWDGLQAFPEPSDPLFQHANPEIRLWYPALFLLTRFLQGDTRAIARIPDILQQDFGSLEPVAEASLLMALYAGWQVLNGDLDAASDSVDQAFGAIPEPFWDDKVEYFPEVFYPVFHEDLDMSQSEALLLHIMRVSGEDENLRFPAVIAAIILIGLYGSRQDHFAWYATLRLLNTLVEERPAINTAFLDLGMSSLEKVVGTPTLMVYDAKYENEINGFSV